MGDKLSKAYCYRNGVVPLLLTDKESVLGYFKDISDIVKGRLLRFYKNKTVSFQKISETRFKITLERLEHGDYIPPEEEKAFSDENIVESSRIVNLLDSVLREGIEKNASDIHIQSLPSKTCIRYRKDGDLLSMLEVTKEDGNAITNRIKLLAKLNILEKKRCQDGRFSFIEEGKETDIRVSVLPSSEGESAVLRLLNPNKEIPSFDELGFSESEIMVIRKMMALESGLVLVTGPTGSGKTTTLARILTELNDFSLQIITIEDPVEYRIEGILQINVDEERGQTFSEILRRLLRHDPDVLMIGEIRDEETADLACRLSLTGHLVFASIHTNSVAETPLRLINMGVKDYVVETVLKGVISQRLIAKNGGGRTVKAEMKIYE